jgi:hypothetical protein
VPLDGAARGARGARIRRKIVRVDLRQLLAAIRRAMWRRAVIPGERLRHVIDEQGDHHVELVLRAAEVEYAEQPRPAPSTSLGRSAWASPDPDKKK